MICMRRKKKVRFYLAVMQVRAGTGCGPSGTRNTEVYYEAEALCVVGTIQLPKDILPRRKIKHSKDTRIHCASQADNTEWVQRGK